MDRIPALISEIKSNPIERQGDVYHPIPFVEFEDLKSAVNEKAVINKFSLIRSALPMETGEIEGLKVLDIGANAGYFSYEFAKLGASIDAIEPSQRYYELGSLITSHYDLDINWYKREIDLEFLESREYQIALMLSVFQWITRGNTELERGKQILTLISKKSEYLFFELGCNWGKSSIDIHGLALPWIYNLLKNNTDYSSIYYLGTLKLWGGFRSRLRFNRYLFCCSKGEIKKSRWQTAVTYLIDRLL